jgi:hypothetical protein
LWRVPDLGSIIDWLQGPFVVVGTVLAVVAGSVLVGVFVGRFIRIGGGEREDE